MVLLVNATPSCALDILACKCYKVLAYKNKWSWLVSHTWYNNLLCYSIFESWNFLRLFDTWLLSCFIALIHDSFSETIALCLFHHILLGVNGHCHSQYKICSLHCFLSKGWVSHFFSFPWYFCSARIFLACHAEWKAFHLNCQVYVVRMHQFSPQKPLIFSGLYSS